MKTYELCFSFMLQQTVSSSSDLVICKVENNFSLYLVMYIVEDPQLFVYYNKVLYTTEMLSKNMFLVLTACNEALEVYSYWSRRFMPNFK